MFFQDQKNKRCIQKTTVLTLLISILLTFQMTCAQDINLEEQEIENILHFITLVKEKNAKKIASLIRYPLRRQYPIPNIKNKRDFIKRFHDIFDEELTTKIVTSGIEQWSRVGSQGIFIDRGILWLDVSANKILAINHQGKAEIELEKKLINKEKMRVHTSIKDFVKPNYRIKTKKRMIRIDQLSDDKFRYASWKAREKESSNPQIILTNGTIKFEGSGGNHYFLFSDEVYTYKVYRNIVGKEFIDIILTIYKGEQIITKEYGKLLELKR